MGYRCGDERDAFQVLPKHLIRPFHTFPSVWGINPPEGLWLAWPIVKSTVATFLKHKILFFLIQLHVFYQHLAQG